MCHEALSCLYRLRNWMIYGTRLSCGINFELIISSGIDGLGGHVSLSTMDFDTQDDKW